MGNTLTADKPYGNVKGQKATFGMQCFWESAPPFGVVPGIIRDRVGFSAGSAKNACLTACCCKCTEVVKIEYDAAKITYPEVLSVFWKYSDPFTQYPTHLESVIFYHNAEQKASAERSLIETQSKHRRIILTKIMPATRFCEAQEFHQKFWLKQHGNLVRMLNASNSKLRRSHVASRLNGYVGRFGTIQMFEAEREELALDSAVEEYIRNILLNK